MNAPRPETTFQVPWAVMLCVGLGCWAASASKRRFGVRRLLTWAVLAGAVLLLWWLGLEVALWRGEVCLEAREHPRALVWLQAAWLLSPDRAEVHFLLARCYRRLEKFERVESHLRKAHELGWDVGQLEREQWLALAQTGQYDEVNPHWSTLFQDPGSDGPEISKAYVTGALSLLRLHDAVRVLDAWEADYPNDPDPHFLRGKLSETRLNWADAARDYAKTLALAPFRTDARFGLARALMKQVEIDKAEKHLTRVVREDPTNVAARVALAQCLIRLDQPEKARELLRRVLQADSKNTEALLEMGNLELAAGRPNEALKFLRPAAEWKSENREIRYAFAKALQRAGKIEESRKQFAFVEESTKPLLRLSKLVDELLKKPRDVEIRYEIASITWQYKSHEKGAKWYLSLLEIDPTHRPTHAALSKHYALKGDKERAAYHRRLAGIDDRQKRIDQK